MGAALDINDNQSDLCKGKQEKLITIPITEGQLEIWVVCTLGGDKTNCSYNLGVTVTIKGPLDIELFTKCLDELVRCHEILRATFSSEGKHILIHPDIRAESYRYDISNKSEDSKVAFMASLNKKDKETPYDLENGPLFRHYLVKASEEEHLLKLGAHHLVCDGWSWGVILQDIIKLYLSYSRGENRISVKAGSYGEYALKLQDYHQSEEYKKQEQFWLNQYEDEIPILDIPTDRPRQAPRNYECERMDHKISGSLYENIKGLKRRNKTTIATILITAFETYLYRVTGQDTITLAMPTAGQVITNNYHLVGHCVNLLPLKSHHNGEANFLTYLNHRKFELLQAYENNGVTYGTLLNKLNIPRDSSRIPLVPVMLSIMNNIEDIDTFPLQFSIKNDIRVYDNFEISILALISK